MEVLNDIECREFPWHPKPVLELTDSNAVQLNEGPCLVLFVGTELNPAGRGLCAERALQLAASPSGTQESDSPAGFLKECELLAAHRGLPELCL